MTWKEDLALTILHKLQKWIPILHPPVMAFESRIKETPFRILISVLLSARTKDETTGKAVKRLFAKADTPQKMLRLGEKPISRLIYPVGFYRQKAKYIIEICRPLSESEIPREFDLLIQLPGIGRKSANLVLALAFGTPTIAVDTHVFRISHRLGWAKGKTPEAVEEELKKEFPQTEWNSINQTLVGFGQTVCRPIHPKCPKCIIPPYCPYYQKIQNNE